MPMFSRRWKQNQKQGLTGISQQNEAELLFMSVTFTREPYQTVPSFLITGSKILVNNQQFLVHKSPPASALQ